MGHWSNKFLPDIVSDVLGITPNPRLSRGDNIRFGTHGSLSLQRKPDGSFVFFNHENTEDKGDAVTFVMKEKGLDMRGALEWLDREYGGRIPAEERHLNGYAANMNNVVYGDAPAVASKPVPALPPPSSKGVHDSALPPPKKTLVGEWLYTDAQGNPTLRVRRFDFDDGGKTYSQAAFVNGKWMPPREAKDAGHDVKNFPYRYAEWHNAEPFDVIFLTEGEKCADAIKTLGLYSSTNAGGASKWTDDLAAYFKDRNVVVMPDADEAGAKWRDAVVASLAPVCAKLHVATIGTHREDKALNDVEDWLKAAGDIGVDGFVAHVKGIMTPVGKAAPSKFFLTSADFVATYRPPEYLVDGMIEGGFLYTLTSPTHHGKTAIAIDLAHRVAKGTPLNGREIEKGRVIYLALENDQDILRRHMVTSEVNGYSASETDIVWRGVKLPTEIYEAAKKEIEETGPVKLIIIDTFQAAFEGSDSNSNTEVVAFMRKVRELTQFPGNPAVIVLAHPTKNYDPKNLVPYGGGGTLNEVDGNLTLWKEGGKEGKVATLGHTKNRGGEFEPINYKLEGVTSEVIKDAKGRSREVVVATPINETEADREINKTAEDSKVALGWLGRHKAKFSTQTEIARALGWLDVVSGKPVRYKVSRALNKLEDAGYVERDALTGGYRITGKGENFIKHNFPEEEF